MCKKVHTSSYRRRLNKINGQKIKSNERGSERENERGGSLGNIQR